MQTRNCLRGGDLKESRGTGAVRALRSRWTRTMERSSPDPALG